MIYVVSHVWAEKNKQFADALIYQMSSLFLYPPSCGVTLVVVATEDDESVTSAIRCFQDAIKIEQYFLPLELLGRRSIGRNDVAHLFPNDRNDIVWFADVDYFFGEGCLEALSKYEWEENTVAVFPKSVLISKTHGLGDECLAKFHVNGPMVPRVMNVDSTDFVPKKYFRAIGGAQIVPGDIARKYGYLNDQAKWQKPTTTPFADTREDVFFRRELSTHGMIRSIDLPNCFRIRHREGHPA
jgi:hypothetical protein